jgi:hypothetical protein
MKDIFLPFYRIGRRGSGIFSVFLTLSLAFAGCFPINDQESAADKTSWDAGDGKVYVRIPLTSEYDRAIADFSHTFDKNYVDYWEAVFQKTGTPTDYFSAVAKRGESYLIVAITPGTYNVLVLGGVNVTGRPNGEKVLLASGYAANQTIVHGQGQEIYVPMSRHTVRVRPYEGVPGGSTSVVFFAEKVGDEQRVLAPGIPGAFVADFIYNAEISNINALIQAAGSEALLAGHLLNPEIFAYAGGVDVAASLFASPAPQVSVNAGAIQFYAGIPPSGISIGEYMTRFNVRYYAFGQPEMTLWNLRRGITAASNDPLGGAVRICFTGPWAAGGTTQFAKNTDGSFDEIHIFETVNTPLPFEVFHAPDPAGTCALVVAGGGGGGGSGNLNSSGGGAGGLRNPAGFDLPVGSYTVTVGGGGIGGNPLNRGGKGGNSSITSLLAGFTDITAEGGGGGGWHQTGSGGTGAAGGSGGGGYKGGGARTPNPVQGNNGGNHGDYGRAGGGGFSAVGGSTGDGGAGIDRNAIPAVAGPGLSGLVPDGFAGGGSGGGGPSASHGGGNGASAARAGQPRTGGGGAGNYGGNGYAGGSGIAVIRFKLIP